MIAISVKLSDLPPQIRLSVERSRTQKNWAINRAAYRQILEFEIANLTEKFPGSLRLVAARWELAQLQAENN
jgi:hypothetical protein